jgi:hypothetical protein
MWHSFSIFRSAPGGKRAKKMLIVIALAGTVTVRSTFLAFAQAPGDNRATGPTPPSAPTDQQDSQRTAAVILVKNALLAVNQGNLTGNYTVLRDLASPSFREKNSAADLAAIFQDIRRQKVDLSPIVVLDPTLNQPRIDANARLVLEGFFDTQSLRINFQLVFLKAPTGGWMIHGVSLNAAPQAAATSALER